MRTRRALAWVIVPMLLPQLVTAPSATARPGDPVPGPVTTLSNRGYGPVAVVDSEGTATAVWATHYWRGAIKASRRPEGGSWSTPVTIGRVGTSPLIGIDAAGVVTVLFSTNPRGRTTGLSAVRREPGRPWGTPKHLTNDRRAERYFADGDEGTFGAHRAELAVSPGGDVIAVWQWGSDHRHHPYRIEVARRPAGGLWSEPRGITRRNWSSDPMLGIDRAGRATLVYHHDRSLVSRRLVPGDGWSGPLRLRGDTALIGSDLVVTPDGDTTLMLNVLNDDVASISVMQRPLAGPWTGTLRVSPEGVCCFSSAVAADDTDTVSVAWTRPNGRVDVVRWAAGTWSPMEQVTDPSRNDPPQLATNASGDLVVWWTNNHLGVRARVRDSAGTWSPRFGLWPNRDFSYSSTPAALYPEGDVLGLVEHRARIRVRRVDVD